MCYKTFLAIHGITKKKVEMQRSLKLRGVAPRDCRGKYSNRAHKLIDDSKNAIIEHIGSFRGRKSHYSLYDSRKTYLPEELNVKKMYDLFCQSHPLISVSYETYRTLFTTKFNINFGYLRTDTCNMCDKFLAKKRSLELNTKNKNTLQLQGNCKKQC